MDAIVQHSRLMTEQGSKSFAVAARLLPAAAREQAYMLYAWCRHADDEIDGQHLGFAAGGDDRRSALERLNELRGKTDRALRGEADEPAFQALARVVKANAIPEKHPLELLHGFEMDVDGRQYRTLDDTLSYSYHVAGVVGVMMAMVMGARERETLNRASDLGIAFQLTNIARDVMDDAAAGRVYLPADWLAEEGVPVSGVAEPQHRPGVAAVAQRLLAVAEDYYSSSKSGLARLPFRAALGVAAARQVYREIGVAVKARGPHAWDTRTIIGRARKAKCVAVAALAAAGAHSFGKLRRSAPRQGLWTHPGLGI